MKKAKTKYAATWAEYNHNNMGRGSLNCGFLGIYPSWDKARDAIDGCILEDVEHQLENYEGDDDLPEEYKDKTPKQIAKGWTYIDTEHDVCVWCDNGIECAYNIREVKE